MSCWGEGTWCWKSSDWNSSHGGHGGYGGQIQQSVWQSGSWRRAKHPLKRGPWEPSPSPSRRRTKLSCDSGTWEPSQQASSGSVQRVKSTRAANVACPFLQSSSPTVASAGYLCSMNIMLYSTCALFQYLESVLCTADVIQYTVIRF